MCTVLLPPAVNPITDNKYINIGISIVQAGQVSFIPLLLHTRSHANAISAV